MVLEPQASSTLLPSQQQLLLRIQYLVSLESNLIFVSGRKGAGKYTIASAFLEQYGEEFNLAWLTCNEKQSAENLRQQLVNQLLPSSQLDSAASLQQHLSLLPEHQPIRWLVVVNQAELLNNSLLVELWGLVEHCQQHPELTQHIGVVLFAESQWARQVASEMSEITGNELSVLQVPALTIDERKQLFVQLQERLDSELPDVQLAERQLNEQDGLPGEVVKLFQPDTDEPEHLAMIAESAESALSWLRSKLNIKAALFIAIALLLTFLLLLWAFQPSSSEPTAPERRPAPELALTKPPIEQLTPGREVATNPAVQAVETLQSSEQVEPLSKVAEKLEGKTQSVAAPNEGDKQRVKITEQELLQIEKKNAGQQPEVKKVQEKPVAVKAEGSNRAPVAAPSVSQPWWQQLKDDKAVLQLTVMSSKASLERFADQHGLAGNKLFRWYPATRNGQTVYIGVYGDYASKAEARAAIDSLPTVLKLLKPWPKSAAAIKQEAQSIE